MVSKMLIVVMLANCVNENCFGNDSDVDDDVWFWAAAPH